MYTAKETGTERSLCIELVLEDLPGGGIVKPGDFKTTTLEIPEGVLVSEDANGLLHPVKTAKMYADATNIATTYQVYKNHEFIVGDVIIASVITGSTARAITAIDTSNGSYDTFTVGTTLGLALTAANNVCLIQADAVNASAGAALYKYPPTGISLNAVDLGAGKNKGCGVVVRGTVNESLLPYYVDTNIKARLPLVRFI